MSENKVKRNCKYFGIPEICKKSDDNCYQCEVARCEIAEKDNNRLSSEIEKLKRENNQLKKLLGEKQLKEVADNE